MQEFAAGSMVFVVDVNYGGRNGDQPTVFKDRISNTRKCLFVNSNGIVLLVWFDKSWY